MENLKEIRLNDNNLVLSGNIVPGGILPQKISELQRTVSIKSNSIVDGALYTSHLSIENGDVELRGAVYSQKEIYINVSSTNLEECQLSIFCPFNIDARLLWK